MVTSLQIKNFKSIVDLALDLGRFNVLIGENGCGKSNILEAIAFAGAASANKLDNEFLGNRGIRIASPELMTSAFSNGTGIKTIEFVFATDNLNHSPVKFFISQDKANKQKWINDPNDLLIKLLPVLFKQSSSNLPPQKALPDEIVKAIKADPTINIRFKRLFAEIGKEIENEYDGWDEKLANTVSEMFLFEKNSSLDLSSFIVYTPDQGLLRNATESKKILPIGPQGEGLFQHLKEQIKPSKPFILNKINENMRLLDWYSGFGFSDSGVQQDVTVSIHDKYLHPVFKQFDVRSANEGFLFLLLYSTLMISKETPPFFAIDNIDASLNPKLCAKLTRNLTELAGKHKKQVIVTTHNPAVLDGLDLSDDSQRLFVVRRNKMGHTIASRVEYKPERSKKLSEIWTDGYIGGLPSNF